MKNVRKDASLAEHQPPSTLQQLSARLQVLLPDLQLNDTSRPVVVLANVGSDGSPLWRALAFDSDVCDLFKSCAVSDNRATIEFQARELFPQAEVEPHFLRISFDFGASTEGVSKPRSKSARGQSASPRRAGRFRARQRGCSTQRAGSRNKHSPKPKPVCSAPPGVVHRPAARKPPPKTHQQASAPSPTSARAAPAAHAAVPVRPASAPSERRSPDFRADRRHEAVPQAPARPTAPSRPSSAPSERRSPDFRRPIPHRPSHDPPQPPKYDGRPGRRLDLEWAGKTTIAAKTGCLSTYMLEAVGLREKYEQLRRDAVHSQAALKKVLEARNALPGSPEVSRSVALWPATHRTQQGDKGEYWEKGDFCPVATHDISKINEVITSLEELEDAAITRLEDCPVFVTWSLTSAKSRIATEKRIVYGRPQLIPKRLLVESQWLLFGDLGKVIFRLYPCGDGSASEGQATIFLWMSRPPGISFTFNLSLVESGSQEADTKAQLWSAPRLWQAHEVHYRLDLGWSEVAAVLLDMEAEKCLDVTIRVLQWHAIEGLHCLEGAGEPGEQSRVALEAVTRRSGAAVDLPPGALRPMAF
mmetsp:Transcript_22012/g.40037  ORF Transcript_22012/g.40037 Transcript_22012/m.40037 type:complete len:587 (+) Transcript_22012:56-1816(+)